MKSKRTLVLVDDNAENSNSILNNEQVSEIFIDFKAQKQKKFFNISFLIIGLICCFLLTFTATYITLSKKLKNAGIDATPIEMLDIAKYQVTNNPTVSKVLSAITNTNQNTNNLTTNLKTDNSKTITNLLLLGVDTRPDGSLLNTDTIMIISYNHKTKTISLISIPRDTIVNVPGQDNYLKINGIYAYGQIYRGGDGIGLLMNAVQNYTGQEIHYYALVNFNAFVDIINAIGGVDIYVDNTFSDYNYPGVDPSIGLHFYEGSQTMDGETALRFARSRQSGDNGEGSDFARNRRQQKVIKAVKDKIETSNTLKDPTKILNILNALGNNIKFSGLSASDINSGIEILKNISDITVNNYVLDTSLENSSILTDLIWTANGYSITPKKGLGDYSDIQRFVKNIVYYPALFRNPPSILIFNCDNPIETISIQNSLSDLNIQKVGITSDCSNIDSSKNMIFNNSNSDLTAVIKEINSQLNYFNDFSSLYKDTSLPYNIIIITKDD